MSCFIGNSCWNMLEVGFPLFFGERIMFGRNLTNLGLKLESFNTTWVISYWISGFKAFTLFGEFSTDYFWSWWGQMQWQHSSCWPNVLACFFDWFVDLICFSFKWLIWLYNDWTGLNYIVRFGLGVRWVPLSYPIPLCPKMKHTHTHTHIYQSIIALSSPGTKWPCLEYVSVLDTSKCKKSQVHELFSFFSPNVSP